ncbi:ABC transporter ATP-binding protein [uncultured Thomasclavelia sp.]|uniref:ABC transporter ATP-binding protein n=1 Tax=uncultured Thomasclavelia sp. TaxID=3025759 RepID=UPI00261D9B5B|nr:ABC transporter ATP-binding protein [uncultured Thomasclavelia sp.]
MGIIIKTEKMKKIYQPYSPHPKIALDNISLTINKGEFISIMGASGSGKTTLINILSSIDEATSGNVFLFGKNVMTLSDKQKANLRKKQIGFIFQENNLLNTLTIKDNILFTLKISKPDQKNFQNEFNQLVKSLEIEDILEKYPYECSGGQCQRTAIARALITKPDILFADEPTGNLDSIRARQLMNYLVNINKQYGITIVMVTHDCLVASYADQMYYVEDGKITNHILKNDDSFEKFYNHIAKIAMQLDLYKDA